MVQKSDRLGVRTRVWVRQGSAADWVCGEIKSHKHGEYLVAGEDGRELRARAEHLEHANPSVLDDLRDLTQLTYPNEPSILHNLQQRFKKDDIYTFAGPVLVAVNPCKVISGLYTPQVCNLYKAGAQESENSLEPHIYLLAANAFRNMVREGTNQSLVISGESGAGKTETTKKALQYFASLSGGNGIENLVLQSNPLLEAFGNAKTVRNDNSSRFGKLMLIDFNHTMHICGARVETYLLEKTRVVSQQAGERNYHIFYQLVGGVPADLRAHLHLDAPAHAFRYLSQSGCLEVEGMDDAEEFAKVCESMEAMGMDASARADLFALVAGVLWLGNVEFVPDEKEECATIVDGTAVAHAASLLQLDEAELRSALTSQWVVAGSDRISKALTPDAARTARDALAKAVYAGVFDHLVKAVNTRLNAGKKASGRHIAILDIFGFEHFKVNSFEQLCINYANERLQALFNTHLFKLEQELYRDEGLDWEQVEFNDNQDVLQLIGATVARGQRGGEQGLLSLLDEQCVVSGSDTAFLDRVHACHTRHARLAACLPARGTFALRHFAGDVTYTASGFLDKNKDTLGADLVELMACSGSELVRELGLARREERERKDRRSPAAATVSARFMRQMNALAAVLQGTALAAGSNGSSAPPKPCGLHFVRCVKPNAGLQPVVVDAPMVMHQLRCAGVLEVVRIAQQGYPTRYALGDFASRYNVPLLGISDWKTFSGLSPRDTCQRLLDQFKFDQKQYKMGRTRIFFRSGAVGHVEDKWARLQRQVEMVQACVRMWRWRVYLHAHRAALLVMQRAIRQWQARKQLHELQEQRRRELLRHRFKGSVRDVVRQWRATTELYKLHSEAVQARRARDALDTDSLASSRAGSTATLSPSATATSLAAANGTSGSGHAGGAVMRLKDLPDDSTISLTAAALRVLETENQSLRAELEAERQLVRSLKLQYGSLFTYETLMRGNTLAMDENEWLADEDVPLPTPARAVLTRPEEVATPTSHEVISQVLEELERMRQQLGDTETSDTTCLQMVVQLNEEFATATFELETGLSALLRAVATQQATGDLGADVNVDEHFSSEIDVLLNQFRAFKRKFKVSVACTRDIVYINRQHYGASGDVELADNLLAVGLTVRKLDLRFQQWKIMFKENLRRVRPVTMFKKAAAAAASHGNASSNGGASTRASAQPQPTHVSDGSRTSVGGSQRPWMRLLGSRDKA